MYSNNLKKLRNEKELTQKEISNILNCNQNSYNNWERGVVMIPLDIADKLSCYYKVRLSYIYGLDKAYINKDNIKPINYNKMLKTLSELKSQNKHSYNVIAKAINCNESTVQRYFTGVFKPPIDRLVLLAEFYNIDLDTLCGKE